MKRIRTLAMALLTLAACVPAVRASAQSITTGELSGLVESSLGVPLGDVQLTVQPVDGGLPVLAATDRAGWFTVPLLSPGRYELLVERLGYVPVVLAPLPVRPGRHLYVQLALEPAEGVVETAVRQVFQGAALAANSQPGRSRYFGGLELRELPVRDNELDELLRFSSQGERALEVEGLPLDLGGFVVGGVPYNPASHGRLAREAVPGLLLPMTMAGDAELVTGRPDVEWPGAAAALLATVLRSGPSGFGGVVTGTGFGGGLTMDDSHAVDPSGFRGSALVGGSMLGDSATAWVFAEAQQRSEPVRYWPFGAAEVAAALETMGTGAAALDRDDVGETRRLNLGGRFDWRFTEGRSVDVFALYGRADQDHVRTALGGLTVPATVEAEDFLAAATATGPLTGTIAGQVRLGFSRSSRDYLRRPLVETGLGDAAVMFAPAGAQIGDPALPSMINRSDIFAQSTLHHRSGPHQLKGGVGARFARHERDQVWGRDGLYVFSGAQAFGARTGVFHRMEGTATTPSFSVAEYFIFGQDRWRVTPGLDLTTGVRYEIETIPAGDLLLNRRWLELTGIDNTDVTGSAGNVGLAVGFDWDVQEQDTWRVRGDFAVQQGHVSPDLLAEALTHDGRLRVSGAAGDVTDRTELGPRLTILSRGLAPPTTTRASLGLSRAIGTAALHVGGAIRETVNLPRRVDLNRPIDAPFRDQYGRPIFGELTRAGDLLVATPGTNRRFGEFDAVTAVSSTATSTYWGVTAALEKRAGPLNGVVSYTYSSTRDDWLGATGAPLDALHPFPTSPELRGWDDGISDLDVPHRFVGTGELTLPFAPTIRVGAMYQRSSGRPFTPGFGRGIDANADGVAGNDPAFVDDRIDGLADLMATWDCLRESSGRFVDRNACRGPDRTLLDAWVGVRFAVGNLVPELRVQALGLTAEGMGLLDTALYRLDPQGAVTTDPASGVVSVPLLANPGFGQPIQPTPELTRIQVSLRLVF